MKKLCLLLPILIMSYTPIWADECATCTATGNFSLINWPDNCKDYKQNCKKSDTTCVCGYECLTCESGYTLGPVSTYTFGLGCYIEYSSCTLGSGGGTTPTCYTASGSVTGNGTGCVEYTRGTVSITRCDSCNVGYTAMESYLTLCNGGTSKRYNCTQGALLCDENQYLGLGECTDCPNGGTTGLLGGGTAITDCYLPSGTEFTDDAGSGTYKEDCYYTN